MPNTLPESESCQYLVREHTSTILERYPDNLNTGYKLRHRLAWLSPRTVRERAIRNLIVAFAELADSYLQEGGERRLGEDGYFCEHASDMIDAMHALLNFDCGRFDCGTLSALINAMAEMAGVEVEP